MRAVIQRVTEAAVKVEGEAVGAIARGLLVYVSVDRDDGEEDVAYLADKVRHLRIFSDDDGKLNRDVGDAGGALLVVSAFTVSADARKGRRPSFDPAAPPEKANAMYESFCRTLRATGVRVETGAFRAEMAVESVNDGPICILLESGRLF